MQTGGPIGVLRGVVVWGLWLACACTAAHAAPGDAPSVVCKRAADKLDAVIVDWHGAVIEFHAEAHNPAVLKMFAEHQGGTLKTHFRRHCLANWAQHEDIFTCFAGTVSEIGAALCHQTDTNRNHWQYRP